MLDAGHAWIADADGLARKHLADRGIPARPGAADALPMSSGLRGAAPSDVGERRLQRARVSVDVGSAGPSRPVAGSPGAPAVPTPAAEPAATVVGQWAADVWVDVGRSIDPRLVGGADWSGLAAALDRASRAGYDVQQHLPRLAASSPLPEVRPARALHYRLVDECAAAITPMPPGLRQTDDQQGAAGALARLHAEADLFDNQPAPLPGRTAPAAPGPLDASRARVDGEARWLDDRHARTGPARPPAPRDSPAVAPPPAAGTDRPAQPAPPRRRPYR